MNMELQQSQAVIGTSSARVLTWGFRTSAALLLLGLVVSGLRRESLYPSLEGLGPLAGDLADGHGPAIIGLGILVMMATPIASTIAVILACVRLGDRRYALITGAVLVILLISAAMAGVA